MAQEPEGDKSGVIYAAGYKAGLLAMGNWVLERQWEKGSNRVREDFLAAIAHVQRTGELPEEA